jgi:drug/metabolite transporter, DME family
VTQPGAAPTEAPVSARIDLRGSLAALLAAACWGTSGIFVKLVSAEVEVSALALAFWRDITTFAILFATLGLLRPDWLRVRRQDLRWLIALGCSLGVFHVLWNLAVFVNGAAVATVQQAAMPAIVAVAAWVLWREPLTWNKIVAILLAFAGTALVSGLDVLGRARLSWAGLLIGLGVPLMYAAWNLFGKKVRERYNLFTTLTYAFAFGTLVLLPLQFFTPQPWPVPPRAWFWFAGLILMATLAGFSIYTYALGRLQASVATILAMSEIAFVAVYAYLLLGERLGSSQILGSGLVVGGVLLLSWQGWRAGPDRPKRPIPRRQNAGSAPTARPRAE